MTKNALACLIYCVLKKIYSKFLFQNIDKTKRKLGVCIDVRGSMATTHVWTGNPEGKGEVSVQVFISSCTTLWRNGEKCKL